MRRVLVLILGMVICLSGCTMIPKYSQPKAPVADQWPSGAAYLKAQPKVKVSDVTQMRWQEFFTDSKLQRIIKMALDNNRDLRLAVLNVEKARALYGVQRAKLLPVVNLEGGQAKQRYSSDFVSPGASRTINQYSVDLGITAWEIDFFGRIRSLKEQALQDYLGTQEARRSAQITLVSEVARVYLTIAADRANLNLARSTLEAQRSAYNLVLRRYKVKIAQEIDLRRAQTQVDTAMVNVMSYIQQEAQDQNALDLLAGSLVPEDLLPSDLTGVSPLMDIYPGLSSEVLFRRPDIMAVEHQLKGAYANIGAARAAFFPSISLTTTLGSASNEFSGLFKAGKGTWTYAPQVVMPIFDARTWAAYRVSQADRKIALTQYEKVIQTAFKEVADVLAVKGTVDQQIASQQSMVDSAEKVYLLSNKRYTNGIDNYLSVLDAQRSLYGAEQGLITMQLTKLINEVRIYAVLGGGAKEDSNERGPVSRDSFEDNVLSLLGSKLIKSEH
ncbi:MAG: efflux transporter outer membrane subunit [Candidatus Omnitrophota bacterium]